ncbi:DUF3732 domain-containing protein [Streptomyces sp. NPDC048415]|uniref:DUF3732 domain-containing protein n=1 Tax=Streptomyces sp. NPDC048415 TaxID=3154822 RepID=UPI00344123ED
MVTGESATGKSTLLGIFEYCLGRDRVDLPVGPVTETVAWYAALFQLDGGRAFVARPAPRPGKKTRDQAMMRLGPDQEILEADELRPEIDVRTLRKQLGWRIGIRENVYQYGRHTELEAHLGHAVLFCIQSQEEIASRRLLFHRQGAPGMSNTLKAVLPYFLGAVPPDQARKYAQLAAARREKLEAQASYDNAQRTSKVATPILEALWREARALGMVADGQPSSPSEMLAALHQIAAAEFEPLLEDARSQPNTAALHRECEELRDRLRAVSVERQMIFEQNSAAIDYATSMRIPRDRLTSLNLLGLTADHQATFTADSESICVLCGSALPEADPSVMALSHSLDHLNQQLASVESVPPASRSALQTLDTQAVQLRSQLLAAERALQAVVASTTATESLTQQGRAAFLRGRIHGVLSTLPPDADDETTRLRDLYESAEASARARAAELDPEASRAELSDRLVPIGQDISAWARQLRLEPYGSPARLDLGRLDIAFDTKPPLRMGQLGSAQNSIGYHVIAHLALHRYFVQQGRPVPRILILDQPTQAWSGFAGNEDQTARDREAIARLFQLIYSVVRELAPEFQVIVCDHVNLPDPWFQDSVIYDWRGGEALVPREWIDSKA